MGKTLIIDSVNQLVGLRGMRGLEAITVKFDDRCFSGNLPIYVLKYGLWALRTGGILEVVAPNLLDSMVLKPGRLPFQLLVQLAARVSEGWAVFINVDISSRRLTLRRTAFAVDDGWSAGVVFSGNPEELPMLKRCLQGLRAQPELIASGDIIVCGPARGANLIPTFEGVRYLVYESSIEGGRFLVGRKKNYLLKELQHERALICHSRVVLRPGALSALPYEFDLITPKVFVQGKKGQLPYLDLGFMGLETFSMMSNGSEPAIFYPRERWYDYLQKFYPYIDGGLFCIRRKLAQAVPLNDRVAWGEGEDAEWSIRLLNHGHLIELATDQNAVADSVTCKLPRYAKFGHLWFYRASSYIWRRARSF